MSASRAEPVARRRAGNLFKRTFGFAAVGLVAFRHVWHVREHISRRNRSVCALEQLSSCAVRSPLPRGVRSTTACPACSAAASAPPHAVTSRPQAAESVALRGGLRAGAHAVRRGGEDRPRTPVFLGRVGPTGAATSRAHQARGGRCSPLTRPGGRERSRPTARAGTRGGGRDRGRVPGRGKLRLDAKAGTDGREVAWNLVSGVNDPAADSERTVWIGGKAFEPPSSQFMSDLAGVDKLNFASEAVRKRSDNLLLVRSRYRQPFGAFSGELPGGVTLAEGYGVMEEHQAWR
ncbi:MAG: DUF2804 family protein [Actinobacteria bacterium]|nr:MAG: DUF2804 family protein [Actinomycetota bacterium]